MYIKSKNPSIATRDEKDHRSGPKTRTGPDSGPSPRPKKIEKKLGPDRIIRKKRTDSDRTKSDRTEPKIAVF